MCSLPEEEEEEEWMIPPGDIHTWFGKVKGRASLVLVRWRD
jgi:hypothetical protein